MLFFAFLKNNAKNRTQLRDILSSISVVNHGLFLIHASDKLHSIHEGKAVLL
jgi:hypothetical protein